MSERRTSKWTDTTEEAFFGDSGIRGREGELKAITLLEKIGFTIAYFPDDKAIQCRGIDMTVKTADGQVRSIDVKANLHTGRDVIVDRPKLERSQANLWLHINLSDPNDYYVYETKKMRRYLKNLPYRRLHYIPREEMSQF